MHLFGSRGLPDSVRRVTGFGVHTFKLVNANGDFFYCKWHFRPELPVSTGFDTASKATEIAGTNPDYHHQDVWDAIEQGNFPAWKLYIQVMRPDEAASVGKALFDITKVWSHKDFPLVEVGKMTLNKNVRVGDLTPPSYLLRKIREI